MTKPPETRIGPPPPAARHGGRLLLPARYRHPGDVIRLIVAGLVLAGAVAVAAPTLGRLGAIEAALIGVGMQSGRAVSAVLPYRLATYWLPVLPGWPARRVLLRREYA